MRAKQLTLPSGDQFVQAAQESQSPPGIPLTNCVCLFRSVFLRSLLMLFCSKILRPLNGLRLIVARTISHPPPRLFGRLAFCFVRFHLCVYRKRDNVRVFCRNRGESHALCLCDAVLSPQVTVSFHCQRTTVFMP